MSESYKPKVVRARLKTGGKTVQSVREKLTGRGFTVRDFQSIIKAGNYLDGLEVQLSLQNWDNYENWHLWNWKQEDDEKVMLAMYQAEQFHPFAAMRNYKNNFEQFKEDWKKEVEEAREESEKAPETLKLAAVFEKDPAGRIAAAGDILNQWKMEYRRML